MTTLRAITVEAFPAFLEQAVQIYAAENVAAQRWSDAEAIALSHADNAKLLSEGVATPGHWLFEVLAIGDGDPISHLWFGAMPRGSMKVAFIYQIFIQREHRRQGHARNALRAAEQVAVARGLCGIALHVFAHNAQAQALYRSLGYQVASLNLLKPLAASGDAPDASTA